MEVIQWANENPGELVLLLLSHCFDGTKGNVGCQDQRSDMQDYIQMTFNRTHGVTVVTSADIIHGMSVKEAENLAKLDGGGMVLAVYADDNFVFMIS